MDKSGVRVGTEWKRSDQRARRYDTQSNNCPLRQDILYILQGESDEYGLENKCLVFYQAASVVFRDQCATIDLTPSKHDTRLSHKICTAQDGCGRRQA